MSAVVILPRTSDERLLELVRDGEERAFEIVVRRYRSSLVGYCMRLGLSEPRAEDAVQQCFLSALLALRRGDEVRDLRAWLGRIAHNVAVNLLRSGSAVRETWLESEGGVEQRAIHIPDMEGGIAARQALAEVAALPPMQREALLQSALGGRSYGEVAASMGLSEGAVRGLLHRARLTLRSAAAAFSPLPLMRRASGWLGGGSPSAGRVLELTGPGASSGLSGTAVRAIGAGVAAIVVAAGVAVGPLHGGHRSAGSKTRAGVVPATATLVGATTAGASGDTAATPAPVGTQGAGLKPAGSYRASSGTPLTTATGGGPSLSGPAGDSPSRPQSPAAASPAAPTESPVRVLSSGPAQVSSVVPTGSTGSGPGSAPGAPPAREPSGETKRPESEEPGSGDGAEREHAEKENAERAEQSEREEEAREREREQAAEKAEREREGTGGKDS